MKLSPEDAELFYKLMRPLQFYVSQKQQILPHITTLDEYRRCSTHEKLQARNALQVDPSQKTLFSFTCALY